MWAHLLNELMEPLGCVMVLLWCVLCVCVCDSVVGEGVVVDEQDASQQSSAGSALGAVKLVVVVVAFVGVGEFSSGGVGGVGMLLFLLCGWLPLYVVSVSLEVGANWRRSTAAAAMSMAARIVSCERFGRFEERIAEDRDAVPESWRAAAS